MLWERKTHLLATHITSAFGLSLGSTDGPCKAADELTCLIERLHLGVGVCVGGRGGLGHSAQGSFKNIKNTGSQAPPQTCGFWVSRGGVQGLHSYLKKKTLPQTNLGDTGLRIIPKWILHSKGFRLQLRQSGEQPAWFAWGSGRERLPLPPDLLSEQPEAVIIHAKWS